MNKFLLIAAAAGISLSAMAQAPVKVTSLEKESTVKAPSYVKTGNARVMEVTAPAGHKIMKTIATPGRLNRVIKSTPALRSEDGDVLSEDVLFESFEGWDGVATTWVPDGWTVENKGDEQSAYYCHWFPSAGGAYYPSVSDGKYYYGVIFGSGKQDEWLISPEVQMPDKALVLSYDMTDDPMWYYSMDNVDWDTYEYVGEKEIVFNVNVLVSVDGGEWEVIKDYASLYLDYTFSELMAMSNTELTPQLIDMSAYAGKKIRVAWQYVGTENQSVFLDHVRIGLPALEAPVYAMPLFNQYWGTDLNFSSTSFSSAFLPVYAPLTWEVAEPLDGVTYTWEYHAPDTNGTELATSEGSELTLTYTPDYTSEFTTRNNLYYTPTLTVSANGGAPASYKNPADYMQMGGEPLVKLQDGSDLKMGFLPANINTDGITFTAMDQDEFGVPATPVFGHDANTDKFWTDYTFHGEEEPGEYSKLLGILNYIPAPSSPMVITGAHLDARGHGIGENVTFYCRIVHLNEDHEIWPEEATMATASLKGKDIITVAEGSVNDYYTLPFTFDAPVVLDDTYPAYVVEVYGFNDPDVEYFAPLQTAYPMNPIQIYIGWTHKENSFAGTIGDSYSPIARIEGAYGPCFNAFLINLEGYYPWLQAEAADLDVTEGENLLTLDSYYEAENLTITAPEWAEVTATGRYNQTVVTINVTATEEDRTGELTITAPGVDKKFTLTQKGVSGINEIIAGDDSAIEAIYNLNGQKVNAASLSSGIYLIKRASGKVEKVVR